MKTLKKIDLALLFIGIMIVFNSDFGQASNWGCADCTNGTGGNSGNNGNNGNNGDGQHRHRFTVPGIVTSTGSPGLNTVFSCTNLDNDKFISVDIMINDATGAKLAVGVPSPNPLSNIGPNQTVTAVTNNSLYFPATNTVVLDVSQILSPGSATISSTKSKITCAVYLIDSSNPPKPLMPLPVVKGK